MLALQPLVPRRGHEFKHIYAFLLFKIFLPVSGNISSNLCFLTSPFSVFYLPMEKLMSRWVYNINTGSFYLADHTWHKHKLQYSKMSLNKHREQTIFFYWCDSGYTRQKITRQEVGVGEGVRWNTLNPPLQNTLSFNGWWQCRRADAWGLGFFFLHLVLGITIRWFLHRHTSLLLS